MNNKLTIGFHLVDECGNEFSSESTLEVFHDLGDTDLSVIGDQFNSFLKQCGYVRYNDHILMEDLTDVEHDALVDFLEDLREDNKT
ncbi:MAG: hypothetical protein J6J18_05800 [Oscillospiraceae bacterium]|nr:hypothetical protein [Oscillospiraceae bacterium]